MPDLTAPPAKTAGEPGHIAAHETIRQAIIALDNHGHPISEVSGLQAALDGKSAIHEHPFEASGAVAAAVAAHESASDPHPTYAKGADLGAVVSELGVNPSGASATVVARLDALDATVAAKALASDVATALSAKADTSALSAKADTSAVAELARDALGSALVAGTNITITPNDGADTITIASSGGVTAEDVRDTMGAALVAGTNVTITVSDVGDTITIDAASGGGLTQEQIEDFLDTFIVDGANITTTYNDAANTLTFAVSGLTSAQISDFAEAARDTLGTALTAGTGITITPNDGADTITVASSAILPTIADAKGDLIVATAADTVSRLAVGANNYVLTADSTQATGVKWAAASGGGGYSTIKDETTAQTQRSTVAMVGLGVKALDDGTQTKVYVPGPWSIPNSTSQYMFPLHSSPTTTVTGAGLAFFVPLDSTGAESSFAINQIQFKVSTGVASSQVRLALFTSSSGTPSGSVLQDFGLVSCATAGVKTVTVNPALTVGSRSSVLGFYLFGSPILYAVTGVVPSQTENSFLVNFPPGSAQTDDGYTSGMSVDGAYPNGTTGTSSTFPLCFVRRSS